MENQEMSFEDMKKEAKELGIQIFGKKKGQLMKEIVEARENPEIAPKETDDSMSDESPKKVEKKFNVVSIFNNKAFIRQYSKAIHGEKFAELAASFASKHKYRMEMLNTADKISCPACGHSFVHKA